MMIYRIFSFLCLLICILNLNAAQAQVSETISLTNCVSNNVSSPTASSMSCTLTNNVAGDISSLSYSTLSGMTVSGPSSCSASANCGTVRINTATAVGQYSGTLTITPSVGVAISTSVDLVVYNSDAQFNLMMCRHVSPTKVPTAATTTCNIRKLTSAPIDGFTYTSPSGTTVTGPSSCTGTLMACGAVTVTTATVQGNYTGALSITPNTGTAFSLPINLTVVDSPSVLSFKSCSDVTPTVEPQRASTTCTLTNSGGAATSIVYSSGLPIGSSVTGPSSCAANSDCGTVKVLTKIAAGNYIGNLTATPNLGVAATRAINLRVVTALTGLNLKSCVDVTPTLAPNQATTSCTLNNASATVLTSISYAGLPSTIDVTGPTSCGASTDCGTVTVTSSTTPASYSGTLTITPNTGAAVSKTINLQVNQPPVVLSLKSCNSNTTTTIVPTAATKSCVLTNSGSSAVSTISYTSPAGQTVVGPTSCGANADCGVVTSTSGTVAQTYSGNVMITPNIGNAIVMPSTLRVNTDTILNLTSCTDVNNTNSPAPAKTTCTLTNTGGTNASAITYSGLTGTGLTASGPETCAANTTCGEVTITSDITARTYNGTLTAAAPTGTAATKVVQLVVNPALMSLSLESCVDVSPTTSPTRATRTCKLRNTGEFAGAVTYSLPTNPTFQLEGPQSCPAKGLCGDVVLRSGTEPGSYPIISQIQIVPSQGAPIPFGGILKVNPREAELVLSNCSTVSPAITPQIAITQCDMRNNGQVSPDDIVYSSLAGVTVTGTRSCPAGSECGKVEIKTSSLTPGSFTGQITITPIKMQTPGKVTVLPVNLEQVGSAPFLDFKAWCTETSPTVSPIGASIRCELKNYGQTAVGQITYEWPAWAQVVSGPNSCQGNSSCGWVEVKTGVAPGTYEGSISAIPNIGTAANIGIRLSVLAEGLTPPTIQITRNPNPLVAGQSFVTAWATTNATSLSYACTANGAGYQGSGTVPTLNGSAAPMMASADWVANPSQCVWTATGEGGVTTFSETMTTLAASVVPPAVNLSAINTNIRVTSGQSGNVNFTGSANQANGQVVKLELFKDSGSGYAATPVQSATGNAASLSINANVSLAAGSYRFKLRATNQSGTTSESTDTIVNVTDSSLLGEISGIRTNNSGKLELFGWACQDTSGTSLNYKVYAGAPSVLGGTQIATGTANINIENNSAAIQALCHTSNVGHHFVIDLNSYAVSHAGKRLFVEVATANNALKATLPCADYSCTMPGAIRIGLTTPKNNDSYTGPAIVFMRAQIDNGGGVYDEIAFNINGEWVNASPDNTPNTYSATKTGVPSRVTPYPVYAKVRQGNTIIFSAENLIYVDAVNNQVSVNVTEPIDNQNVSQGTTLILKASANLLQGSSAQIQSVKFTVNGTILGNATSLGSGNWGLNWTPAQIGPNTITARVFNESGTLLGESAAIRINVTAVSDLVAGSATPIPVDIAVPYLSSPDAGSLPGSLGVDKNGSANYSIPIALPPGTNGMVPNISLNYSSDNTTGSAGLGWSLGGISNIDRCGKTVATDGVADTVRFEVFVRVDPYNLQPTDRLCLDGQRLILVSGNNADNFAYWDTNAEYRTEIESFAKVTTVMDGGKRSFKIEYKNGHVSYYGATADSYVTAVGRNVIPVGGTENLAHRWRINRSVDRSGNAIDYLYSFNTETGENKPRRIRWGANANASQSHFAQVTFNYESRPDAREAYVAGARNDENLRLSNIETRTEIGSNGEGGIIGNTYQLSYQTSPTSGRSLLKSIKICDDSNNCLPSTEFTWGEPNPSAIKGFVALGGTRIGPNIAAMGQAVGVELSPTNTVISGDFNGDGKTDLLERYRLSANNYQQSLYTSSSNGLTWVKSTPFAHLSGNATVMETGDFDGDGRLDVLIADQTLGSASIANWRICLGKNSSTDQFDCNQSVSFPGDAFSTTWNTPKIARLVKDFNADGRDDIFLRSGPITSNYDDRNNVAYTCLSTGEGFNCIKVAGPEMTDITNTIDMGDADIGAISTGNTYSDVDGDGRVDQLTLGKCVRQQSQSGLYEWYCGSGGRGGHIKTSSQVEPNANRVNGNWFTFPDFQTTVLPPPSTGTMTGDFSADGFSDIVFGTVKLTSNGGSVDSYGSHICLSKGNGFSSCKALPSSGLVNGKNLDHFVVTVTDFDGDGIQDVLRPASDMWLQHDINGYRLCRIGSSGNFHSCENWSGPVFKTLNMTLLADGASDDAVANRMRTMFMGDFDGDGKQDLLVYHGEPSGPGQDRWEVWSAADQAKPNEALDKLISVKNGLGLVEKVQYSKANDTDTIQAQASLPNGQDAVSGKRSVPHRQVVKQLSKATGNGNWLDTTYRYAGYSVDPAGRGSLGFAKVEATNVQSGIVNTTWYWQTFPHAGSMRIAQSRSGGCLLNESSTTPATVPLARTVIPYVASSTNAKRDLNCAEMGTTVTTVSAPDNFGNSTTTITTQSKGSDDPIETKQIAQYDNKTWPLSELNNVIETRKVGASTAPARTIHYTYDSQGRVVTEVKQQGDTKYKVTTIYDRSGNLFGLVNKTHIQYLDPIAGQVTRLISDITYTSNGRFPETVKNALGHYETKTFDARHGAPIEVVDANALVTKWQVDGFGRKLKQSTPDGTDIYTYQKQCGAQCPSGAVSVLVNDTKRGNVRVAVPSLVFSDSAGHPVRSITWGFKGELIGSQTLYDNQGRVQETYQPRIITHQTNDDPATGGQLGMRYFYDAFNRVVKTQFNDNGQLRENSTEYNGLTIKVKNAKDQSKSDTKDVAGRIVKSVDANSKITLYSHDPYNNLTKTTDPLGNVVLIEYDDLGRRKKLVDPDLGINTYVVNPIGQVIEQVSPKQRKLGQKTTMKYDELGRMFARDEPDLKGRWVYDQQLTQSCRTNKTCGKLIESYVLNGSTKDNQQTHSFDSWGRPSSTTLQRDVAYTQTVSYDTWGRPLIETQQRASEAVKTFERRYNGYGFQYQTLRKTSNGYQVLWQADQLDASQRLTTARLGNLLKIERSYEADTGRLSSASLKTYTNTQQLGESYTYDALGNVANRQQNWGSDIANQPVNSFDEIFTYDALNRLKTASVTGFPTQTFDYNDIGNLISKTGVGSYTYPSTINNSVSNYDNNGMSTSRPHAVASTTLHSNFSYDENGNLVSGAGRSLTWTSFDMPATINKGTESSSFVYGADHQRTRQSKTDGAGNTTDVYYAGAMEVEKARSTGVIISIKTNWPGGLGVEIDKPSQNAELRWTHTDRLGSVIAITNEGGALVERLAYDSWGKRRSLSGNETLDSIDGITDNKGFTGHEMLDKLDLVHMNGRIYDPLVARFMSADPIIQDPMHSQSYNRYTYVWNNPTNLTDPTGFVAADRPSSIAIQNCAQSVGCQTDGQTITGTWGSDDDGNWVQMWGNENAPSNSIQLQAGGAPDGKGSNGQTQSIGGQTVNRPSDKDIESQRLAYGGSIEKGFAYSRLLARNRLRVLDKNGVITIEANVLIYGADAEFAAKDIMRVWNGVSTEKNGKTITTRISVSVAASEKDADVIINSVLIPNMRVAPANAAPNGVINVDFGRLRAEYTTKNGLFAHEFSHVIGIKDQYFDLVMKNGYTIYGTHRSGFEDSIFAYNNGILRPKDLWPLVNAISEMQRTTGSK